jgi:GDP-L-fucose synthase
MNNKKNITIWGSGKARREFMYVNDLADFIYYSLTHFDALPQNINVGLGHDYTINEYYQIIAKMIDYQGLFDHDLSKPEGMQQKLIDDTKLKALGWQYQTSLEDGIKQTYQFYLHSQKLTQ